MDNIAYILSIIIYWAYVCVAKIQDFIGYKGNTWTCIINEGYRP